MQQQPADNTPADDIVRVRQSTLIGLSREARQLPLRSRSIRASFSGQYQSSFKGRGMEFDESRPYQPGDDIRAMDWRVTARTGKAHSKVYREERERPVLLWVDYRQPMFFATQQHFKSVLAARIAALLAWSATFHGDRLGGLIFSEQGHSELRPARGKTASLHFIQQLAQQQAAASMATDQLGPNMATSAAADSLARLQHVNKPGSLIFLISDFRQMNETAWLRLSLLSRNSDLVLISVYDPLEQQLPPAGDYKISDGQRERNLSTYSPQQRQQYAQRFLTQRQTLQDKCRQLSMHLINISTADDCLLELQRGLGLQVSAAAARRAR